MPLKLRPYILTARSYCTQRYPWTPEDPQTLEEPQTPCIALAPCLQVAELRGRKDVMVLTVTRKNRDRLVREVVQLVRQGLGA